MSMGCRCWVPGHFTFRCAPHCGWQVFDPEGRTVFDRCGGRYRRFVLDSVGCQYMDYCLFHNKSIIAHNGRCPDFNFSFTPRTVCPKAKRVNHNLGQIILSSRVVDSAPLTLVKNPALVVFICKLRRILDVLEVARLDECCSWRLF